MSVTCLSNIYNYTIATDALIADNKFNIPAPTFLLGAGRGVPGYKLGAYVAHVSAYPATLRKPLALPPAAQSSELSAAQCRTALAGLAFALACTWSDDLRRSSSKLGGTSASNITVRFQSGQR
jgi:hypothetical protein